MPLTPTDEQVRATAIEILQRAPYARWRQGETLAGVVESVVRWLAGLNDWLFDLSLNQPVLYWLMIGTLLLSAVLLLAHVVWSVRVALSMPVPAAPPPTGADGPSLIAEAESLAAQGRFLDAAHRLQLASIELLLTRRVLTLSRFEPNRVLRARLRATALPEAEQGALLALVDRLESHWFRDRANDAALYGDWYALHRRLRAVAAAP